MFKKIDSIIFGFREYLFAWKSTNSKIFGGTFHEAEKSRSRFGRQQSFELKAANFRGVCSEIVTWCLWNNLMFGMLLSLRYEKWFEDAGESIAHIGLVDFISINLSNSLAFVDDNEINIFSP